MKKIILLRHAKSSWKQLDLADHDRPLNKRGRAAAPVIGAWMIQNGHVPQVILCSTSVRTRETLDRLGLPLEEVEVHYSEDLYLASPDEMLSALQGVLEAYNSAMIIAHQPGLSAFADALTRDAAPDCRQAFEHFPTAAVGVFQSDIPQWRTLNYGSADFTQFAKPDRTAERNEISSYGIFAQVPLECFTWKKRL